jgi:hypothetical protein
MRILTRGDFDGLTCTVLLSEVEQIDEIRMAHPKDAQDGKVSVEPQDIVVNLPFILGCGMWFDHHSSEEHVAANFPFKGRFEVAPSCARVIYNHYAPAHKTKFERFAALLEATDRFDSADLTMSDVTDPAGYMMLGQTLDPRSGLSADFKAYFTWLAENLKKQPIEKLLEQEEIVKRSSRVLNERDAFKALLQKCAHVESNVIVSDLRGVKDRPAGNRFLVFTLFPQTNVDVRLIDGRDGGVVIAVGHSIFNRTCRVNIGRLMQEFGGGGHKGVGTAQLRAETAKDQIKDIIERLKGT